MSLDTIATLICLVDLYCNAMLHAKRIYSIYIGLGLNDIVGYTHFNDIVGYTHFNDIVGYTLFNDTLK